MHNWRAICTAVLDLWLMRVRFPKAMRIHHSLDNMFPHWSFMTRRSLRHLTKHN